MVSSLCLIAKHISSDSKLRQQLQSPVFFLAHETHKPPTVCSCVITCTNKCAEEVFNLWFWPFDQTLSHLFTCLIILMSLPQSESKHFLIVIWGNTPVALWDAHWLVKISLFIFTPLLGCMVSLKEEGRRRTSQRPWQTTSLSATS